jgi:HNH endonuclease/NUMOD4 motif
VPGWEGWYEVSDQGHVRSLDRAPTNGRRARKGRTLKAVPNGARGYPHVILTDGLRRWGCHVHVLVARAFIGPRPDRLDVCHRNSINTDTRVSNLRYGTRTSNALDRVAAGHDHHASSETCRQNHPYTEANTGLKLGVTKDGDVRVWRYCKACKANSRAKTRGAA